ncbi:MAG: hypothetical protein ACI90V_012691, partial [Bacillariaceae sp.]
MCCVLLCWLLLVAFLPTSMFFQVLIEDLKSRVIL